MEESVLLRDFRRDGALVVEGLRQLRRRDVDVVTNARARAARRPRRSRSSRVLTSPGKASGERSSMEFLRLAVRWRCGSGPRRDGRLGRALSVERKRERSADQSDRTRLGSWAGGFSSGRQRRESVSLDEVDQALQTFIQARTRLPTEPAGRPVMSASVSWASPGRSARSSGLISLFSRLAIRS